MNEPYFVDDLVVPDEFTPLIAETLSKVKALASRIDDKAFKDITVFVDPIDGTREFATGKGEFVTILIGILVNRIFYQKHAAISLSSLDRNYRL